MPGYLKAGFYMIADDRKESCFHIIADDRRADCCHAFRFGGNVKITRHCAGGKMAANNMADLEEVILLQADLFLLLVLKRRHRQLQNRRKPRFWGRKNSLGTASCPNQEGSVFNRFRITTIRISDVAKLDLRFRRR